MAQNQGGGARSSLLPQGVKPLEKALFFTAFAAAFLFMSHPDLWETANHSYVLLESLFSGRGLDFYRVVAEHGNTYYYVNNANYNIAVYLIFGAWELPVFLFNRLFGLALNESFLWFWAKLVSAGFFVGCGVMLRRLALLLGMDRQTASLAGLFFVFDPVAFFSPMAMGQYDTLCLFFILWALCWYVKGDLVRFSLVIGAGAACKFFALLVFVPLLLLAEKRIRRLVLDGLCALWLLLPTTLLFRHRMADAPVFTQTMIDRLFKLNADTGIRGVSVFTLGYALLVFAALLCTPKNDERKNRVALYFCLASFGWLFLCIYWHPQWLILLSAFIVLTTFEEKNRAPWFWLDLALAAGYYLNCFYEYPNQTGAVLFDGGLLGLAFGRTVAGCGTRWVLLSTFLEKIPYVWVLTPVLFCGAILANLIFKLPLPDGTPAERLCADRGRHAAASDRLSLRFYGYLRFGVGFVLVWLVPAVLEALNAFTGFLHWQG